MPPRGTGPTVRHGRLTRTGMCVALGLLCAAVFGSSARADDPPPPSDPPVVTLPAEPDPAPDPSPPRSTPTQRTPKATHSTNVRAVRSRSAARQAPTAQLPIRIQPTRGAEQRRSDVSRVAHLHRIRVKRGRPETGRSVHVPAAETPPRPTHDRLASDRFRPLAAHAEGSSSAAVDAPLMFTTTLLACLLALFAARKVSPRLVAVGAPQTRSRPARDGRRQPRPPRASARPLSAPPPAARTREPQPVRPPRSIPTEHTVREPSTPNRPPSREVGSASTCEIRVFRGYVKSQFYAEWLPQKGPAPKAVAQSRWFRRRGTDPPAPERDVVAARDQLLLVLEANGWVRTGRGNQWYSDRFERRVAL